MKALAALFARELRLANRAGGGGAMGVVFFLILVTIAPFAIGPDLNLLARIGPAILWIAALLSTLLGLDRLFLSDHEDGSLDLLEMADTPLEAVVLVKCLAHWAVTGLPLVRQWFLLHRPDRELSRAARKFRDFVIEGRSQLLPKLPTFGF